MSDAALTVDVPVTEAATPAQESGPATLQPEAPVPFSERAHKSNILNEIASKFAEGRAQSDAEANSGEQPRGPDGKFLPKSEQAAPESPAPKAPPAADGSLAEPATPANAEAAPESPSLIRIAVPDGHSLRAQGVTEIPTTPENERAIRALLNTDVRRSQVESLEAKVRELTHAQLQLQAERDAYAEQVTGLYGSPAEIEEYQWLRENNPAMAETYMEGIRARAAMRIREKREAADAEYQQSLENERLSAAGREFAESTFQTARQVGIPEWWLKEFMVPELFALGQQKALSGQQPTVEEAVKRLHSLCITHPHIQKHLQTIKEASDRSAREAEQRRIQAEREEEERKRLEAAAHRHSTNSPLASIPGNVRTDRVGGGDLLTDLPSGATARKNAIAKALGLRG